RPNATRGNGSKCMNSLKQLGLAIPNYAGTYGYLPPDEQDLPANDPTVTTALPVTATGNARVGFGTLVLILPYLEQESIYEQLDVSKSIFSTFNLPPPWGSNTANPYGTVLQTYLCPTSPAPPSINYYN